MIIILEGQLILIFIDLCYGPVRVAGELEIRLWKMSELVQDGLGVVQATFNISTVNRI